MLKRLGCLAKRVHKLAHAAREAIAALDHHGIYLALAAVDQQPVKLWPAFLRSAHSGVHAFSADIPAAPLGEARRALDASLNS